VLWYPPTDLGAVVEREGGAPPELQLFLRDVSPERLREASPATYVGPAWPPTLTMTGSADHRVPVEDVRAFHDLLTRNGVLNELEVFEGQGHSFDLLPLHWETCFDRMVRFLDEHLRAPASRQVLA
jgi:dipeptidyl aminopeptidase/acylaminoacyl peptidase